MSAKPFTDFARCGKLSAQVVHVGDWHLMIAEASFSRIVVATTSAPIWLRQQKPRRVASRGHPGRGQFENVRCPAWKQTSHRFCATSPTASRYHPGRDACAKK